MLHGILLALASAMAAPACEAVDSVSENIQVAWISPVRQRVSSDRYMEVVQLSDLRSWIKKNGKDQARLLQTLGLVGKRAGWRAEMEWKVTIFDVRADWVCRPIRGKPSGEQVKGVPVCHERLQRGGHRYTGCGYTMDTHTGKRGLDHYRLAWRDAAQWGFCVMPLERLLEGN
ncbi:MAG: hypothetical protein VX519_11285 [Myxococcota bacterium]|nr:hypothetical protein [Myxococcota bacterium]